MVRFGSVLGWFGCTLTRFFLLRHVSCFCFRSGLLLKFLGLFIVFIFLFFTFSILQIRALPPFCSWKIFSLFIFLFLAFKNQITPSLPLPSRVPIIFSLFSFWKICFLLRGLLLLAGWAVIFEDIANTLCCLIFWFSQRDLLLGRGATGFFPLDSEGVYLFFWFDFMGVFFSVCWQK